MAPNDTRNQGLNVPRANRLAADAFVRGLGRLTAREQLDATALLTLADTLDACTDASKMASLVRRYQMTCDRLQSKTAKPVEVPEGRPDELGAFRDRIASKRKVV